MNRSLRIVVADDELDMQTYYRTVLPTLGHQVVGVSDSGHGLVEKCRELQPDLVITDIKMPDMDGLEAATQIYCSCPIPIMLVSAFCDPEFIRRAEESHILSYLIKPIKLADLEPAIAIVMRRFEQFQSLRGEAADLKQAMQDRKLIERAKGLMMKKASIDEAAAFERLQKLAVAQNQKLVTIAKMLITSEEAFEKPTSARLRADRH